MSRDDDCYEDYEQDYDDCCHEEYEADILVGIATCDLCGHRWMQTKEEIQREIDHIAAYHEYEECENDPPRRRRIKMLADGFIMGLAAPSLLLCGLWRSIFWKKRPDAKFSDDEIPF